MILIECTNDTRPADFLQVAQHPTTYNLLGFSATGTPYPGDFAGHQCRVGTSNELGEWDNTDPMNPVYTPPSVATVTKIFNAAQDVLREKEYEMGLDNRIKEAYRKDVHPRYNGAQRAAARQQVVDEFERVEALYPKV